MGKLRQDAHNVDTKGGPGFSDHATRTALDQEKTLSEMIAGIPGLNYGSPLTPESLVPRLGEQLVSEDLVTSEELTLALVAQKELAASGKNALIGQLLVEMGALSQEQLSQAVTRQIIRLRAAQIQNRDELERKVEDRTNQLQQALGKLAQIEQLKSNFISSMSHELRTPMYSLLGYTELFADGVFGRVSDEQRELLRLISSSSGKLHALIETLLGFTDFSSGVLDVKLAPISLRKPIATAVDSSFYWAHERQIDVDQDLPANTPNVYADDEKIAWVISQFLGNSIKSAPTGGRVKIQTAAQLDTVSVVIYDCRDCAGHGDIFESILNGPKVEMPETEGELGLSLACSIVEAHGSQVFAADSPGIGSRFLFSLPTVA